MVTNTTVSMIYSMYDSIYISLVYLLYGGEPLPLPDRARGMGSENPWQQLALTVNPKK